MNLSPTHNLLIYRRYIKADKLKQKRPHACMSLIAEISVWDRYIADFLPIFPSNDCRLPISCRWVPISDISTIFQPIYRKFSTLHARDAHMEHGLGHFFSMENRRYITIYQRYIHNIFKISTHLTFDQIIQRLKCFLQMIQRSRFHCFEKHFNSWNCQFFWEIMIFFLEIINLFRKYQLP